VDALMPLGNFFTPSCRRIYAVVDKENWGATVPFILIVTIYDNNWKRILQERPFVGRSGVFAVEERTPINLAIEWQDNKTLLIRCLRCTDVVLTPTRSNTSLTE
jgi:hypothetical protein